jgi:hypothetical protein
VAMEEAQEAPDVVIGMFLINDTSTVVLFDSGASAPSSAKVSNDS